jgi:hypothetical protein
MQSVGQEAISILVQELGEVERPLEIIREDGRVKLQPSEENTFAILLVDDGHEATLHACAWHGHFDDPKQAAFCALWLLTPYYRVVEEYRRERFLRAYLERYWNSRWEQIDAAFEPFWTVLLGKPTHRHIYQQGVLSPPEPLWSMIREFQLDDRSLPPGSPWKIGNPDLNGSYEQKELFVQVTLKERPTPPQVHFHLPRWTQTPPGGWPAALRSTPS